MIRIALYSGSLLWDAFCAGEGEMRAQNIHPHCCIDPFVNSDISFHFPLLTWVLQWIDSWWHLVTPS